MSEQDYAYRVNKDNQIEITRYMGEDEVAVIPETIEGLPVTVIKRYAFASADVVEVGVGENVRIIEQESFVMCDSLERIKLPSTLEFIGAGAFKSSEKLSEISFPNGNEIFCVEDGILYDRRNRTLVLCPSGLKKN